MIGGTVSLRINVNWLILTCVLYGTLYLLGNRFVAGSRNFTSCIHVGFPYLPISRSKGVTPSRCIRQGTGILLYREGTTIPPLAARVIVTLDFYPACADIRYEHLCVADQSQLNQPTINRSVSIQESALFLKPLGHIPVHKRWTSD